MMYTNTIASATVAVILVSMDIKNTNEQRAEAGLETTYAKDIVAGAACVAVAAAHGYMWDYVIEHFG